MSVLANIQADALIALNRMPWFWRRVLIGAIIIWSMGLLTYLAVVGNDTLKADIGFYVSGVLVSTMGSYLFGATWDNQNERKANLAAVAITPPVSADTSVQVNP